MTLYIVGIIQLPCDELHCHVVSFPSNIYFNRTGLNLHIVPILYFEPEQLSQYNDWLRAGRPGFDYGQWQGCFSLRHRVQTIQPPIQ
jgi:hypothetical protein